jgi:hypothetical protein
MNSGRAALGVPALAGPQRVNRLKAGLQTDGSWKGQKDEGQKDGFARVKKMKQTSF